MQLSTSQKRIFVAVTTLSFACFVASAPHLQQRQPQYGFEFQEEYASIEFESLTETSASLLTGTTTETIATYAPTLGVHLNSTTDYPTPSNIEISSTESGLVYIENPDQKIYSTDDPVSTLFLTVSPLPYPYDFIVSSAPESTSYAAAVETEAPKTYFTLTSENTDSTLQHYSSSVYYPDTGSTVSEIRSYLEPIETRRPGTFSTSNSAEGTSEPQHSAYSTSDSPLTYTVSQGINHSEVTGAINFKVSSSLMTLDINSTLQPSASSSSYTSEHPATDRKVLGTCRALKTVVVTKTISLTTSLSMGESISTGIPSKPSPVGSEHGIPKPSTGFLTSILFTSKYSSTVVTVSSVATTTSSSLALEHIPGDKYQDFRSQQETTSSYPSLPLESKASPYSFTFSTTRAAYLVASRSPVSSLASLVASPPIKYASGSSVIVPAVFGTDLHGPSSNEPTTQYVNVKSPAGPKLPANLLTVGVNGALSTDYGLSADTGVLEINAATHNLLANLKGKPHLSRDGGKGGYLNGQHLFLFCDTGSFAPAAEGSKGNFVGFVSSSVAVDKGKNGLFGKPLVLEDGIGQWSDDVGRMRGFAPLTTGEQSYNKAMQGHGQRYAIWAESSLIPFNTSHALIYAPIVYDNVDKVAQTTTFTYTGTTLLAVTAGGSGGPRAERIVGKIFNQDDPEWGVIAGLRSYGPSGIGGNDGRVYVFACATGGLLVGRVGSDQITSRDLYEYWNGNAWVKQMPSKTSTAYAISGSFMDGDIFYSPTHLTFIFVYLNTLADNKFYYRYLMAPTAIRPSVVANGVLFSDYAENIVKYPWSHEIILYEAPKGPTGKYIYAGGVQLGYYGGEDISNGGKKSLLSWTVPTGADAASQESEYSFVTAEIIFH